MRRNDTLNRSLPVPVSAFHRVEARGPAAQAPFMAQALGASGAQRGLRGGAPVLHDARTAYLSAAWSGTDDRRSAPGALRRTQA